MTSVRSLLPPASLALAIACATPVARADDPLPPLPPPTPSSAPASPPASPGATNPPSAPVQVTVTGESRSPWTWRCNGLDRDRDVGASTGCSGVFGVRGSVVNVHGAPSGDGVGLMFSLEGEDYGHHRGIWSSRGQYWLALGGGGAGLEGALDGAFAFGFRAPVTEHQGPVVRAGAQGYLIGDDAFLASLVELPQLQVGWQWSQGHAVVELAGTSGVALTGRFRAGETAMREIGHGFALGGHASVQVPWIRLSLEAEHLPTDDAIGTPLDMVRGTACAVAAPVAICADARGEQGRFLVAGSEPMVRATYAGLTLGLTGEK